MSPISSVSEFLFKETPVTEIVLLLTVTEHVAVLFPSEVLTVIVALPAFLAVIVPFETVATLVLLDVQVTFLLVALLGLTVAVNVSVPPTTKVVEFLFKETPVTLIVEDA